MTEGPDKERKQEFGGVRFVFNSEAGEKEAGADLFSQFFRIPRGSGGKQEEGQEGKEEKSEIQKQIEFLLEVLGTIGQMEDGTEKQEAQEAIISLVKAIYSGLTQQYRPAFELILPIIGELLGKDLNLILLPLLKLSNEVGESEEVEVQRQRGREIKAKKRKAIYDAYAKAGFTPDQAMALLMNDIAKPSTSTIQEIASVASSAPGGTIKGVVKKGIDKASKRKQA
ncbi:MAG TPA: hypothetical protein P5080_02940 [Candidatus Paceibacterota bacterium]|nr:hypothetical protein [Candidatus Pacearchaeota archaeon]HRZ50924.1 hypothetical protein [Candidatus Paceibacterota bacterium]HSA36645.1 hypothetical protein [Candidatus Paceibacterota bacterium]